ncbi:unnamed protein product [Fraxinus pennsylvanica]|uniref:Uncharacterized protein n=1 Tax=Fraxinus pennsylvanica TaxID=56036 RepID=A0AAD2E5K7_9LAMI|nr:unnamed protein product [Fraxinus pennsylvanica]
MSNLLTPNSFSSTATCSTTKRLKTQPHQDGGSPPLPPIFVAWTSRPYSPTLPFSSPSLNSLLRLPFLAPPYIFTIFSSFSIHSLLISTQNQANSIEFSSFDPISNKWWSFPPPPPDPPLGFLFRHRSFISRELPIQSVSGNLVLLAATADEFLPALSRPIIFNPLFQKWTYGPHYPLLGGCAPPELPAMSYTLRVELGPTTTPRWERMGALKHGKFSRDAIDAIGWRGKLCMVNVKGDGTKEGAVYDVQRDA